MAFYSVKIENVMPFHAVRCVVTKRENHLIDSASVNLCTFEHWFRNGTIQKKERKMQRNNQAHGLLWSKHFFIGATKNCLRAVRFAYATEINQWNSFIVFKCSSTGRLSIIPIDFIDLLFFILSRFCSLCVFHSCLTCCVIFRIGN